MCTLVNQIEKGLEKEKNSFLCVTTTIVTEKKTPKETGMCIYNHIHIYTYTHTHTHTKTYTQMFIAALYIIANRWK